MAYIQQQDENNNQNTPNTGAGTAAPQQGSTPSSVMSPNPQRKGSGRFTNLQKYIGANTGAGEQLGSRISNQMGKQYEQEKGQAQSQAQKVAQGIQQGQQTFGQGGTSSQINQQLQNIGQGGYDARQFVQDPQFQQYQTIMGRGDQGDAYNEQLMREQAAQYQQYQDQANMAAQQRMQNLASEGGRSQLLQQAVGGPGKVYTSGQRKLDALFLQGAPGNQIGQLSQQARAQQDALRNLTNQYGTLGQQVEDVAGLEDTAKQQLGQTATGLEQGFINNLESSVEGINQQRQLEQDKAMQVLAGLQGKNVGNLSQEDFWNAANQLGLEQGEKTYGALSRVQNIQDIANLGQMASNYQDVATQEDVDKYGALAQLAGITDPMQMRLSQAGNIGNAVGYKENYIQNLIDQSRKNLETLAGKTSQSVDAGKFDPSYTKRAVEAGILNPQNAYTRSGEFGGVDYGQLSGGQYSANLGNVIKQLESGKNLNQIAKEASLNSGSDLDKSYRDTYQQLRDLGLAAGNTNTFKQQEQNLANQLKKWLTQQKYYETFEGPKFAQAENPNYFNVEE